MDQSVEGLEGEPFDLDVERGKIAEFARATYADHPAFFARDGALVPPAFFTTMFHWMHGSNDPLTGQLWDRSRSLQAAQSFTFPGKPPTAGMRLVGKSRVDTIEPTTARGRPATRFVLTTTFTSANDVVATSTLTVLELATSPSHEDDRTTAHVPQRERPSRPKTTEHLLDPWDFGTLDITDIVRFEGVVGVWNPIHHDPSAARKAGFADVITIGMLPGSLLGTYAVRHRDPLTLRRFEVRFHAPVLRGDRLRIEGAAPASGLDQLDLACVRNGADVAVSATAVFGSDQDHPSHPDDRR